MPSMLLQVAIYRVEGLHFFCQKKGKGGRGPQDDLLFLDVL
jgi:hypothetical protein